MRREEQMEKKVTQYLKEQSCATKEFEKFCYDDFTAGWESADNTPYSKWIDCGVDLPSADLPGVDYHWYLVFVDSEVEMAAYVTLNETLEAEWMLAFDGSTVTPSYWMPLSSPPHTSK